MLNTRSFLLRCLAATALGCGCLWQAGALAQETYPVRPIRVIVPYAPGGTSDLLARYVSQKLGESWGQPVVVENRAGGGTVIGASAVSKAAPDGYTLLFTNNTHVINPLLMANLPYDAFKDFTPVARLASSAYLLLLNPAVPAATVQDYIALAKRQPGKLNFGTGGPGGLTHLGGEIFNAMAGVNIQMVHYKGAAPLTAAGLSGEIDAYLDAPATTVPLVETGKLKAIGVTGSRRLAMLPQVPTIAEAGLPGFDVTISYVLLAPAGLPTAVADKLNTELNRILAQTEVDQKLQGLGLTPFPASRPELVKWLKAEHDKYGKVVKTARIKIE